MVKAEVALTQPELVRVIKAEVASAVQAQLAAGMGDKSSPHDKTQAVETKTACPTLAHHNAICDSCDRDIAGIRYKCLDCSDFDFCQTCFDEKFASHKQHRFVKIATTTDITTVKKSPPVQHYGTFCDGSLCNEERAKYGERCIRGVRYTCLECEDFDLCARCQTHPDEKHSASHTLIRIVTPTSPAELRAKFAKIAGVGGQSSDNSAAALANAHATILGLKGSLQSRQQPPQATLSATDSATEAARAEQRGAASLSARHLNVNCDICGAVPVGARYACLECDDFDLCSTCFAADKHDASHIYTRHTVQVSPGRARPTSKSTLVDSSHGGPHACDACGSAITTTRRWHCDTCADFDLCEQCIQDDKHGHDISHPMHVLPVVNTEQQESRPSVRRITSPEIDFVQRARKDGSALQEEHEHFLSAKLIEARGVSNGSIVVTKGSITKAWLLENDGMSAWPAGTRIASVGGVQLVHSIDSVDAANAAQPGARIVVSVAITAPERAQNNVISYWQLQTPTGMPFGPKLWLDIDVKDMEKDLSASTSSGTRPTSGGSFHTIASSELVLPSASTELVKDGDGSSIRTTSQGQASLITGSRSSNANDDDEDIESSVTIDIAHDSPATAERESVDFSDDEYDLLDNESLSDFPTMTK